MLRKRKCLKCKHVFSDGDICWLLFRKCPKCGSWLTWLTLLGV